MSAYYDLEQILRLEGVMGPDLGAIVPPILASLAEAVEDIEAATAAGDLDGVTRAAHRGRNDALVLGARPLLKALTELEAAGRDLDQARAAEAFAHVRDVWPPTRDELTAAVNLP